MFICENCGALYDEVDSHSEYRGECHGYPCYEECDDDCHCGGTIVEAKQCKECGEYTPKDGYDLCEDCLRSAKTYSNAIKVGEYNYSKSVPINDFLSMCFDMEEINEILLKELNNAYKMNPEKYEKIAQDYFDSKHEENLVEMICEGEE